MESTKRKIAKIFFGNPKNQKGLFNNVIERTKHLIEVESNVDCYIIRLEHSLIIRVLKKNFKKPKREDLSIIDGLIFKNLWITMGIFDYLITHRFNRRLIVGIKQIRQYTPLFRNYDLLSVHGLEAAYLSTQVKKRYNIPFVTTWHGSDINITPFSSNHKRAHAKQLLDAADHNFFVSKKLLDTSNRISDTLKKSVLYTGPASSFKIYNVTKKDEIRNKLGIKTKYVVGFIGNLIPIKNVLILPFIFKELQSNSNDISFVIVGDGDLEDQLKNEFNRQGLKNLHMLGSKMPSAIPDIMNCLDILILPSLNEGLPMVTMEALACGVHVIGSNRGGIPEIIDIHNCFELDDNFVNNVSTRIIDLLHNNKVAHPELPKKFSWSSTLEKEISVHNKILKNY